MTDLETRLHALRVSPTPPSEDVVLADVRRARSAGGRRRAVRLAAGGVGLLAVGAVAATAVVANQPTSPGHSEVASGRPSTAAPVGKVELVSYSGPQQPGFEVAKVPDGFVLQGATPYSLDIARADDHSDLNVFEGKLVVMLQSKDATFRKTDRAVQVHGTTGYLRTQDGTVMLDYRDGEHVVEVQSWKGIGLTDAQLADFANGVTVTSAAQQSVG
jgi:hypothetical protein